MNFRIKNTNLTIQIISWLQIIGGINGLGLMGYIMLQTGTITGGVLLILLIGVGLFGYSIYSGKRLLTNNKKESAIILSIINYSLQLLQWKLLGYGLTFGSGAELTIGIKERSFTFNFSAFFSSFNMSINSDTEFYLKVNLVAILIIITLFDILREFKATKGNQGLILFSE